jgi:uncharacterized protein YyaL (SSP411 family)
MSEKNLHTNRLSSQKSPYLQQHAHNPVDWYPWGEEAFRAADREDKPIFLSIGYATCHWCHVMEKESFENDEVAQALNENFICIKVDREELPEVDSLYMEFAQTMMEGAGGWPLNLILTPRLEPFFASTYLPPHNTATMIGLIEVLARIVHKWHSPERAGIEAQAELLVEVFAKNIHERGDSLPALALSHATADHLFRLADPIYGGIRGAPKFPIPYQNSFMLLYSSMQKDSRALFLVERTIEMILQGGIYDQLGGGIARYSIDEKWCIPHFEKMLYDNALFAQACLELWQATKKSSARHGCEATLDYILRDMRDSLGGFYSAEDADSAGKEGLFYTWTPQEIAAILGAEDARLFCEYFDVTAQGNFDGRNVLFCKESLLQFSAKRHLDPILFPQQLARWSKQLFAVRAGRPHPFKDDKILASWNGLAIFTMATAAAALNEEKYQQAAEQAAEFIQDHMWKNGLLARRWREGASLFHAGLDEYAFLIRGLLRLFEVGAGTHWLIWAIELSDILSRNFKAEEGAFYESDGADRSLLLRKCSYTDGAEPSGNAIHCENLLRLYQITQQPRYLHEAEDILRAVRQFAENYPPGYIYHAMNIQRYWDKQAPTLVVALNGEKQFFKEIRGLLFSTFIANQTVIWRSVDDPLRKDYLSCVDQQVPIDGKTTLYICRQGYCQKPLNELSEILEAIHKL